jgi:hypothetical protein
MKDITRPCEYVESGKEVIQISGIEADEKQEEAIVVYNKLNQDRQNLIDDKRNDSSITTPFFWHHIRQDRRRQAIIDTWQQAKPGTVARTLFDQGATTGEHAPNWVTLWLLYSVFRSRDIRNNRNRRAGESGSSGGKSIRQGFREFYG